jgi:TrpR-related protein YerC/YecD
MIDKLVKTFTWKTRKNQQLVEAILTVQNNQDAENFLRDLLTEKEILEFAGRLQAAKMLSDREIYTDIEKETGLSSATVARVSKWLNSEGGGYRQVLEKLHHHRKNKKLQRNLS